MRSCLIRGNCSARSAGEEKEFGITTITVEEGEVDERGEYSPEKDGEKQPGRRSQLVRCFLL